MEKHLNFKSIEPICIASENNILCEALFEYLGKRNFENIGIAGSEKETIDFLCAHTSSILIISSSLLDSTIFQTMDALKKIKSDFKVILLSNDVEILRYYSEGKNNLVKGLLSNHESMSDLYYCIMEVAYGLEYQSNHVKRLLQTKNSLVKENILFISYFNKIKELTKREMEIFVALSSSLSTKSIAEKLYISPATVNNHKASITCKLSLRGKNQLLSLAVWYRTTIIKSA